MVLGGKVSFPAVRAFVLWRNARTEGRIGGRGGLLLLSFIFLILLLVRMRDQRTAGGGFGGEFNDPSSSFCIDKFGLGVEVLNN
jgi:hypothetical protein